MSKLRNFKFYYILPCLANVAFVDDVYLVSISHLQVSWGCQCAVGLYQVELLSFVLKLHVFNGRARELREPIDDCFEI